MEIYSDTKIYMMCPANIHSGGPELCHQLVSQLLQFGVDAYIFYLAAGRGGFNSENPIDEFYKKYHLPYVLEIEDDSKNILIFNESANDWYYYFKNVRKIFWWMSVDNYIKNISQLILNRTKNALAEPMPKLFYFEKDGTEHWVQSEYARQFCLLNAIPKDKIYFVEDYLNQAFLSNADKIELDKKKNVVTFNPVKGAEVTSRLIALSKERKFKGSWIAIENMTPSEVQALLARAKVYIDFGNHPGKDRIPREAALSGCVIITGTRGAAANDIDINIPAEFKFDEKANFQKIIDKILDVFKNFDENYRKQKKYRTRILDDKPRFAKEVAAAFNLETSKIDFVAVAQGLSETGINFVDALCENNVIPDYIVDDTFANSKKLPNNDLIKTFKNEKYFCPKILNGSGIMIISKSDAKFLYAEGRISKFVLMTPTDEEINSVAQNYNAAPEDVLSVDFT